MKRRNILGIATAAGFMLAATANAAPPVTAGLKLHLDASQLTGLSDGQTVTTWTDFSGSGNNATAGGTPIYKTGVLNGKPVIRFNNASSFTTANLSSQFPTAATVFIVTTISSDNNYTLVDSNGYGDEWWRYDNGFSYPALFRGSRLEQYCLMPNSGSHLFAVSSSASAWEMAINGTSQGVAGGNYNAGGELVIGNGSSGGGLNGDIAEVLIYDRVLTSGEADQVGAYLTAKYGLSTLYGPPIVISSTPPDDSTTVPTSDLVLTFNKPLTIGTGNITIKNLTDTTQTVITLPDSQVSVSGAVLTINPTSDLVLGKNYAVQIDAGAIESFAGILDDTTWNFAAAAATPTTIAVATSGTPSTYGDSVTFTATVSPTPSGGTVQFYANAVALGAPVAVNITTGEATVTTTTLGATTNEITAAYSGNYQFAGSSTAAPTSQVVNKAGLTVTAQNVFRLQNTANPDPLPHVITGFQNGETLGTSGVTGTPALSTTAVPSSSVGPYPITCAVGTLAADNYDFTFVGATLAVVAESLLDINVNITGGTTETESALSGPAGGLGTIWNQFLGPGSPGTLVHANGVATTVTIDSNFGLPYTFDDPVIDLPMLRGSMTDFGKGADDKNVTINGLKAGGLYDIWLVTLRNQPFYSDGTEQYVGWWSTINTTTSPNNQLVDAVGLTINTTTFVNGYNYVLFQSVKANDSGQIVFTGVAGDQLDGSDNNHRLGLNGLQIKELPPAGTVMSFF